MNAFILPKEQWKARAAKHETLIAPYADAFLERRNRGKTHPVHDFLFTYYTCSPAKLRQWVPSIHESLEIDEETLLTHSWLNSPWFSVKNHKLSYKKERFPHHLDGLLQFIEELCVNISAAQPRFGCFGLHEWAMVYKQSQEQVRHSAYPLRLSPEENERFVESQTLCCTHYDAYRFFTEEAKPRNTFAPALQSRLHMEQGGCLHANMDLYKWSIKLWPWIGSDFIAKAFFLALKGRELDMRASPYDLKNMGYTPICIETEEGRRDYQKQQQQYAAEAAELRQGLRLAIAEIRANVLSLT